MSENEVSMKVNGSSVSAKLDSRILLVHFLREHLNLTGTHIGCDTSQCGACTVHVNGIPAKSCSIFAVQLESAEVTTIEGVAAGNDLHPMQEAFRDNHGLQCGYCTPGMIMQAIDIARRYDQPTEQEIRHELEGNLCRCTGYHNIVKSVKAGVKAIRDS